MATQPTSAANSNAPEAPAPSRLQSAREKTSAFAEQVGSSAKKTGEQIVANPTAVVASGLIAGAVLGLLIPISRREKELLAPVGSQVATFAGEAFEDVRENGRSKLNEVTGQLVSQIGGAVADAVGGKDGK